MLGHSHALSGLVTGMAAGTFVMHEPPGPLALFSGLTAAYALAPDMDHCGTTEARSFGFVTEAFAWVVGKISGGHRHGTHSVIGVAAFTAVAWAACLFRHTTPGRVMLAVILAVSFAAAMDALRVGGHGGNALAIAGAAAMAWTGYGLALVPVAAALGASTHIAGDCLTVSGCPLLWPFSRWDYRILPHPLAFVTGSWREHVVAGLLLAALGFLVWRDASVAVAVHHLHAVATVGG